jgi:2-dehydropantoate 2-reductase
VVQHLSQFRRVAIGELDGKPSARLDEICQVWQELGVELECKENIQKILWTKFIFISALSGVGSLVRLPVGDYRSIPETRSMLASLMREVEAVARAQGIRLDSDIVRRTLVFIDQASPQLRPSMQVDVETGRRTELDSMIGVICRQGRELGLPTPIADLIYATLLPVEMKALALRP